MTGVTKKPLTVSKPSRKPNGSTRSGSMPVSSNVSRSAAATASASPVLDGAAGEADLSRVRAQVRGAPREQHRERIDRDARTARARRRCGARSFGSMTSASSARFQPGAMGGSASGRAARRRRAMSASIAVFPARAAVRSSACGFADGQRVFHEEAAFVVGHRDPARDFMAGAKAAFAEAVGTQRRRCRRRELRMGLWRRRNQSSVDSSPRPRMRERAGVRVLLRETLHSDCPHPTLSRDAGEGNESRFRERRRGLAASARAANPARLAQPFRR